MCFIYWYIEFCLVLNKLHINSCVTFCLLKDRMVFFRLFVFQIFFTGSGSEIHRFYLATYNKKEGATVKTELHFSNQNSPFYHPYMIYDISEEREIDKQTKGYLFTKPSIKWRMVTFKNSCHRIYGLSVNK